MNPASDEVVVELLPHQMDFFHRVFDLHQKEGVLVGGIGSGKTYAGAFTASMLSNEFDCPGLICANTYAQLRDSTLQQARECWENIGFSVEFNENKKHVRLDGRQHYWRSLENYEDIRGMEVGWVWFDEIAFGSREAYQVVLGRLRHPNGPRLAFGTTTGNGQNWIYEYFVEEPLGNPELQKQRFIIRDVSSRNNKFLPADYLMTIAASYSGQFALQEIGGQLVSMTGNVFKAMNDGLVIPYTHPKDRPFFISIDFGRRRPCVLFITEFEKDKEIIFDALLPEDVLIDDLIARIKTRGHGEPTIITCDPAGDSGNTHTYETDISRVRESFPSASLYYTRDPARTRIEVGISMLENRLDRKLLYFSENLKHRKQGEYASVVSAFYELHYPQTKDGKAISNQPEKDGKNDHPVDAARYWVINRHPVALNGFVVPEHYRRKA